MADTSIVFCGEAGQGIQSIENALMQILKKTGYHCFATKEYMSRIRGGSNSTEIRIADHQVSAFVNRIDFLILLNANSFSHISKRISPDTCIIGPGINSSLSNKIYNVDFRKIAHELKSEQYTSAVAIGFILEVLKIPSIHYENFFTQFYGTKAKELATDNILAAQAGTKLATDFSSKLNVALDITPTKELETKVLLNGSESLAYGAIAGGCNFISSYPMSPSTGVLTNIAALSKKFEIIVEQAEDEIAAINMALGAWYAGGRALVTTSGGGFALMGESISLAGMTETPIVINLAQRPGPATGLPTRTEQGDLNLALYAGHGEFPRIIYAPGSTEQAFYLMQKAFYLADQYQIPVIILSDQFFVDSFFISNQLDPIANSITQPHIIATPSDYKRYQFTNEGISPRGIPGFGDGIVCVDSDEHTEAGYITEDFVVRTKMVQKRLHKQLLVTKEIVLPDFIGQEDYTTLIISWGSNFHVIKEALEILKLDSVSFLHFSQIYPLPTAVVAYFTKAKKTILFENNATGQFAQLLKQQLEVKIDKIILQYNGMPFAVEEIVAAITENLK